MPLKKRTLGESIKPRGAFRRLFSDGLGVVRFELGIGNASGDQHRESIQAVHGFLDLPIRVAGHSRPVPLEMAGKHIADLYRAATEAAKAAPVRALSGLVRSLEPVVLVEYTKKEFGPLPHYARCADRSSTLGVDVSFAWLRRGERVLGVWFLETSDANWSAVRRTRVGLLRLHAEHQVLKQVLNLLRQGVINYVPRAPAADRVDEYLNRATRVLGCRKRGGISLQGIREDIAACDEIASPDECALLRQRLRHVRRQVRQKLEAYLEGSSRLSQARDGTVSQVQERVCGSPGLLPDENEQSVPPPPYEGGGSYVFVSYAHEDRPTVYPELAKLHRLGFRIWYDEGIVPGRAWLRQLAEALVRSSCVLAFLSARSVRSRYCLDEIHFALENGKQVTPIHLEPLELPAELRLQLGRHQAILKHSLIEERFDRLLRRALPLCASEAEENLPEQERAASAGSLNKTRIVSQWGFPARAAPVLSYRRPPRQAVR